MPESRLKRCREEYPISLNAEQEEAIRLWAADDRLVGNTGDGGI